ncbi:hypothetical protein [Acaryochloris sp. CCMEE 5410]|uniref:hypothetical protein n=1 Tax=Acaryochloris sp. CCMEE 5410 TaxID=310037 RepID=UPI0002484151|nr:hypothetical protein [Acaryochloris sp. CCMEE 5410]KAI9133888.1 hypothetical protein ON05_011670 [Acaryochloris sp. CCMEE 5410]
MPTSKFLLTALAGTAFLALAPQAAQAAPSGTWLSQPQIRYHVSSNTLNQAMAKIKQQKYKVVFLDFRNVSDEVQQQVSQVARQHQLKPVVWIQSPQLRSLTVSQLVHEARHTDGLQVDDHYFTHYSQKDFFKLRRAYTKTIYCSIQPFQAKQLPSGGCNQVDVQCYTPSSLANCMKLADRLNAVTSLSAQNTYQHRQKLAGRRFNVFLWPYSNQFFKTASQP